MSIEVKMYNEKWRISITGESWEFPSDTEMKETFDKIVEFKKKYGKGFPDGNNSSIKKG